MLYFAAVITYERHRAAQRTAPATSSSSKLFLCADDATLGGVVDEALARLSAMDHPPAPAQIKAYEEFVEAAIRPYNTAGLFHPAVPNMYHHTAAPAQVS